MIKVAKIYILNTLMLLFIFLASCSKGIPTGEEGKPLVVTTIGPYQFLLNELAGNYIDVLNLSEDSGDPHTMQLTPQQSVQLKNATMFFSLNPIEEDLVLKALSDETKVIEMWHGFPLLSSRHAHDEDEHGHDEDEHGHDEDEHGHDDDEHDEDEHGHDETWDEHFWLDPVAMQTQISMMAKELSALLPEQAEQIQQNEDVLLQRSKQLAEQLKVELAQLQDGKIFSFHSSLAYFANFFNAEELYIESQGIELGSKEILELSEEIRDLTFPVLIYSPQFQKDKALALAQQLGLELVEFDPQKPDVFANLGDLAQKLLSYN